VPSLATGMFMYGGGQYVLRLDGFISVSAGYEQGEFITKPLKFSGDRLELNYSTAGAGRIRVEIQDDRGAAIDGFTLDECPVIHGDHISRFVKWNDSTSVSKLSGQTVRLRFVMNEADIFALRFTDDEPADGEDAR